MPEPVDRSQRVLSDGSPETPEYHEIDPATGQQKGYIVLTKEERGKGFVRPVRRTYTHSGKGARFQGGVLIEVGSGGCGTDTSMSLAIAETYARDPGFYDGTFCVNCREHRPLEEFVWQGTSEQVGS